MMLLSKNTIIEALPDLSMAWLIRNTPTSEAAAHENPKTRLIWRLRSPESPYTMAAALEEKSTMRLEVAAATLACVPRDSSRGPSTTPPPMPNSPAQHTQSIHPQTSYPSQEECAQPTHDKQVPEALQFECIRTKRSRGLRIEDITGLTPPLWCMFFALALGTIASWQGHLS